MMNTSENNNELSVVIDVNTQEVNREEKSKKRLSKGGKAAICICVAVFVLAIVILLSVQLTPNKTSDKEFIETTTRFVTMDYDEYRKELKKERGITNLKKVKLLKSTGKAEYKFDEKKRYVTSLCWTTEDVTSYDELLELLEDFYGREFEENEESGKKLEIPTYSDENKNLSSVLIKQEEKNISIEWETANSAYIIDKEILSLGEITLESKEQLDSIQESYLDLDEEYRTYVEQYDVLEKHFDEYYMLYVDYFDKTANECFKTKSADNYDTAVKLMDEYKSLDKKYQKLIKNYDILKKAKNKSKQAKHDKVIKELELNCTGILYLYSSSAIKGLIEDNVELLSDDEISDYISYAVYSEALEHAEDKIKSSLKNPNSYVRYDYSVYKKAMVESNKLYYVRVSVDYGATNSFNAMVRGSDTIYVYYTVNKSGIIHLATDFSAYDKWQMTK